MLKTDCGTLRYFSAITFSHSIAELLYSPRIHKPQHVYTIQKARIHTTLDPHLLWTAWLLCRYMFLNSQHHIAYEWKIRSTPYLHFLIVQVRLVWNLFDHFVNLNYGSSVFFQFLTYTITLHRSVSINVLKLYLYIHAATCPTTWAIIEMLSPFEIKYKVNGFLGLYTYTSV